MIRRIESTTRELLRRKRLVRVLALALFLVAFVSFGERIVSSSLQAAIDRTDEPSRGASSASLLELESGKDSLLASLQITLGNALGEDSRPSDRQNNDQNNRQNNGQNNGEGIDRDAREQLRPRRTSYRVIEHSVAGSLYQTAYQQDIPLPLLRSFVDVMSYDVDFQRDIWSGAHFRMLVRQDFELTSGGLWRALAEARLDVAELDTGSGSHYRYHRAAGGDSFYDKTGKPAKRLLRRTPMSGLRLTSRFGARRHPILGYTRVHKGVDFAAPSGTPILAAGDGVVRHRRYAKGGYGRYIILRHNQHLSTLYAHMRSFTKGVRVGTRVKQGEVIGYVGTSGLSTGAHLHYEIHLDGRAVNPRTVRLPERLPLVASARSNFMKLRAQQDNLLASGGDRPLPSARDRLRGLVWLSGRELFSQNSTPSFTQNPAKDSAIASKP